MNAARLSAVIRKELKRVPSQVARQVAHEISRSIQVQFDTGRDPYGMPWKPLSASTLAKGRRPPPLTDTGAGRRSVKVRPASGAGVRIDIGRGYMIVHQKGARNGRPPQRMIVPVTTMPQAWVDIYESALVDQINRVQGMTRG